MAENSLEEDARKYGWLEEGLNVERRVDRQKVIEELIQETDAELAVHFQERKPLAERSGKFYSELIKKGYKPEDLQRVSEMRQVPTIRDDEVTEWIYLNRHIKGIDRQIVSACEYRVNLSEENGRIVSEIVEVSESSPLNLDKLHTRIGMAEEELLCFSKHIGELQLKVDGQGGLAVKSDTDMLAFLIGKRTQLEEILSLYKSDLHYLQNPEIEEEEPMSPSRQQKLDRFGEVGYELYDIRKEIQQIASTISVTEGRLPDSIVGNMSTLFDKRRSFKFEEYSLRAELNVPKELDSAGTLAKIVEIKEQIEELDRKRRDKRTLPCEPQLVDEIDRLKAELTVLIARIDDSDPRKSLVVITEEN